jgi:membrane-associated phospholipid phosphatase
MGETLWADARALARAPAEIGRVTDLSPEPLLLGAALLGGLGGTMALDSAIRGDARRMDDHLAGILEDAGTALSWGSLAALYGAGWWADDVRWRRAAFTGTESALVSLGLARLAKLTFGRQRPDADRGSTAWFTGGASFVSDAATPAFAIADAVSGAFDHAWWASVPAYAIATAVGVGRMGQDRHWTSDIVASAALGIATTRLFTLLHRQRDAAVTFVPLLAPGTAIGFHLTLRF